MFSCVYIAENKLSRNAKGIAIEKCLSQQKMPVFIRMVTDMYIPKMTVSIQYG